MLNSGRFVTKSLATEPHISSALPQLELDRKSRERVLRYLVEEPDRVTSIGRLMVRVRCFLLVAAAIGNFATKATNIALSIGGKLEMQKTLSDVYPAFRCGGFQSPPPR
jgi:hypothetical protein